MGKQVTTSRLFVLEAPDACYPCTSMAAVRAIMAERYPHVNIRAWRDYKKDVGFMSIIKINLRESYQLTVSTLYKYSAPNKGKWDRKAGEPNAPKNAPKNLSEIGKNGDKES